MAAEMMPDSSGRTDFEVDTEPTERRELSNPEKVATYAGAIASGTALGAGLGAAVAGATAGAIIPIAGPIAGAALGLAVGWVIQSRGVAAEEGSD